MKKSGTRFFLNLLIFTRFSTLRMWFISLFYLAALEQLFASYLALIQQLFSSYLVTIWHLFRKYLVAI